MKEKNEKKSKNLHKYPLIEFNRITSYIRKLLYKKYCVSKTSFQKNLIKNIIYDDKTRLVANFKEQLIINDLSEYMKRYYRMRESIVRLKKYFNIYEEFSKLFPNYTPLNEAKYIYLNIHKKQKIIDLQQDQNDFKLKRKIRNKIKNNNIFNNDVYESIEKNSEKINSEIFDISNDELNNSILQIKNIINNIDKYGLNFESINFSLNGKNLKNIKNKNNIIINNYYYNNNSILTKKFNLESLVIQPKINFINSKNFAIIKNNILTNLKKPKTKLNTNKVKSANSYQLNKTRKNEMKGINNIKYSILENTFNKINKIKHKNKNKSVINYTNSNRISNHISFGMKNLKMSKRQKGIKRNSNIFPHTSRINNYKNMKLINIFKKIGNSDINNSLNLKNASNINKNKIKINRSLINKIINNKTLYLLSDRTESNLDSQKNIEKSKITTNQTKRDKLDNNKLKNYLGTIKNNAFKKSINIKDSDIKKKFTTKKINYSLKTDRGIYYLNNLKKTKKNSLIKNEISKKSKENNKTKKQINKINYISGSFLTNENIIKNKHRKKIIEKNPGNSTGYVMVNMDDIDSKNRNNNKINSKVKIKGIHIKNFNKIFHLNKAQTNVSSIKTSERTKNIELKKQKNKIQNFKFIKKNSLISYTDREKAKRLFFSNNV